MHDLKQMGVKGNYVPAQNLHMTLAFIGEWRQADEVKAAMDAVSFSPFRLNLTEIGSFGNLLYAGVKGNQAMKGTVREIRAKLEAAGISYDQKEFKPHITLIRKYSGQISKTYSLPKADMQVKKISLMKSENKNGKTVYTEIYSRGQ